MISKEILTVISRLSMVIFFSCSGTPETDELARADKILSILDEVDVLNSDFYLVIPDAGCPRCISREEQFLIDHLNYKDRIKYILTNFRSKKNITIKLGIENF